MTLMRLSDAGEANCLFFYHISFLFSFIFFRSDTMRSTLVLTFVQRTPKCMAYLSKIPLSFMHRHLFKALIMPWLIFEKKVINKSSHGGPAFLAGPQLHNEPSCPPSFSRMASKNSNHFCRVYLLTAVAMVGGVSEL